MKTVSLELSKELMLAGYPRDTYFYWDTVGGKNWHIIHIQGDEFTQHCIVAPTLDEILDKLPVKLKNHCVLQVYRQGGDGKYNEKYWHVAYNELHHICNLPNNMGWTFAETAADAAAKMYLYLKKENLL